MNKYVIFVSLLLLSGCNPNIQLDPSQWVCSKVERLKGTGKSKIEYDSCVEWSKK